MVVPTTLNSNSVDRRKWRQMGVPETVGVPAYAVRICAFTCCAEHCFTEPETTLAVDPWMLRCVAQVGTAYLALGAELSFTCAPYLLDTKPGLGEQVSSITIVCA